MSLEVPKFTSKSVFPDPPKLVRESHLSNLENILIEQKEESKRMIVLHTRKITDEDIKLFQRYGVVLFWEDIYINIDIATLKFDYLFCDLRNQNCLKEIEKFNIEKYNACAYINFYEQANNTFDQVGIHVLTSFPEATAYKKDFDHNLMFSLNIEPQSDCISVINFLVNIFNILQRK